MKALRAILIAAIVLTIAAAIVYYGYTTRITKAERDMMCPSGPCPYDGTDKRYPLRHD